MDSDIYLKSAEYIRSHLDEEISLGKLADHAYLSKFHFHRMFKSLAGTTAASFVRAEKLRLAEGLLLRTRETVTDIAFALGFNSADVFTRAFKRVYGETPSAMRERVGWLRTAVKYLGGLDMIELIKQYPQANQFTAADKRECLPLAETLIEMAEAFLKRGAKALTEFENQYGKKYGIFFIKAVSLLRDGISADTLKEILRNYIIFSNFNGAELLKRLLIYEATVAMRSDHNAYGVREHLLALFGEQFHEEAVRYLSHDEPEQEFSKQYFKDAETSPCPPETNLLEETFLRITNFEIQSVLLKLSEEDFLLAFRGASKKVQQRICYNLSRKLAARAVNACVSEPLPETSKIVAAQRIVLNAYEDVSI